MSYFNSSGAFSAKERYSMHLKVRLVLALIGSWLFCAASTCSVISHSLCRFFLCRCGHMGISIQGEPGWEVTEHTAHGLDVHAILKGEGGGGHGIWPSGCLPSPAHASACCWRCPARSDRRSGNTYWLFRYTYCYVTQYFIRPMYPIFNLFDYLTF